MRPFRVFLARKIPPEGLALLRRAGIRISGGTAAKPLSPDRLAGAIRDSDGLLTFLDDKITDKVLAAAPRLRIVANAAVGYDNIDIAAARRRGIAVTNTPGVLDDATADLAWALILAAARRVVEADAFIRSGKFEGWGFDLFQGKELRGATLGLVGFGRIGKAVARRAAGFGMKILYTARSGHGRPYGARRVPLGTLLSRSDVVSLHLPYAPELHHLIDAKAFARMKRGSILVNTARGKLVDEAALVRSLKSGRIAAAGLDVYEREPGIHPGLLKLRNAVLLPHIGSATVETRREMILLACRNLAAVARGKRSLTPVEAVL